MNSRYFNRNKRPWKPPNQYQSQIQFFSSLTPPSQSSTPGVISPDREVKPFYIWIISNPLCKTCVQILTGYERKKVKIPRYFLQEGECTHGSYFPYQIELKFLGRAFLISDNYFYAVLKDLRKLTKPISGLNQKFDAIFVIRDQRPKISLYRYFVCYLFHLKFQNRGHLWASLNWDEVFVLEKKPYSVT